MIPRQGASGASDSDKRVGMAAELAAAAAAAAAAATAATVPAHVLALQQAEAAEESLLLGGYLEFMGRGKAREGAQWMWERGLSQYETFPDRCCWVGALCK